MNRLKQIFFFVINISKKNIKLTQRCKKKIKEKKKIDFYIYQFKKNNVYIKMNTTQLISAHSYDTSKMIFSDPIEGAIPDSTIKYRRINISTKNNDGSMYPCRNQKQKSNYCNS